MSKQALADPWKREKIYDVLTLLKGVIAAQKRLHLFVNVKEENLQQLLNLLPAENTNGESPVEERMVRNQHGRRKSQILQLIPTLRKLAQGLVVHEPQQVLALEEIANGTQTDEAVASQNALTNSN